MTLKELTKEERIKAEINRLNALFEDADGNKKALVKPLIENAAFMKVTLEEMQLIILRDGVIDHYRNGKNQEGEKSSAAVQGFNALVKNYTAVIKTLLSFVPLEVRESKLTQLMAREEPRETEEERRARINAEIAEAAAWQAKQRAKDKADN